MARQVLPHLKYSVKTIVAMTLLTMAGIVRAQVMSVTATQLQKAFLQNSVAATKKYAGETVLVVGRIENIYDARNEGDPKGYISLWGSDWDLNDVSLVICMFDRYSTLQTPVLKRDSMAQVQGVLLDYTYNDSDLLLIWIEGCNLVVPYTGPRW